MIARMKCPKCEAGVVVVEHERMTMMGGLPSDPTGLMLAAYLDDCSYCNGDGESAFIGPPWTETTLATLQAACGTDETVEVLIKSNYSDPYPIVVRLTRLIRLTRLTEGTLIVRYQSEYAYPLSRVTSIRLPVRYIREKVMANE